MFRDFMFVLTALLAVAGSACDRNGYAGLANQGDRQPVSALGASNARQEPLDPELASLVCSERSMCKVFAWSSIGRGKQQLVGVGKGDRLMRVIAARVDGTYSVSPAEPVYASWKNEDSGQKGVETTIIRESGALKLDQYLPETEVAFGSIILDLGTCRAHFILVWKALSRTSGVSYASIGIDIRIITEDGARVLTNRTEGFSFFGVHAAYLKDVDGDGRPEYVFVGGDNYEHLYIWKINADCSPDRIGFEEEDGDTSDDVTGRGVFLTRQQDGSYAIHTKMFEPIGTGAKEGWTVTETIYTWDASRKKYKMTKKTTSQG